MLQSISMLQIKGHETFFWGLATKPLGFVHALKIFTAWKQPRNMQSSKNDFVPTIHYLGTLKFKLHIILMCQEIFFLFFKPCFYSCGLYRNRQHEIKSPRNGKKVSPMIPQKHNCLNKSWSITIWADTLTWKGESHRTHPYTETQQLMSAGREN